MQTGGTRLPAEGRLAFFVSACSTKNAAQATKRGNLRQSLQLTTDN